jgi:predicted dehydrogenase
MVASQVRYRDPGLWLFAKSESGGGILSWLGCHWLDLIRVLLNDEIAAVSGAVATLSGEKISVEDCACISFRFRNNAVGSLTAGYLLPVSGPGYGGSAYDTTIRIWGTEGRIVWDEPLTKTRLLLESNAPPWREAGRRETDFDLPRVRAYGGAYGLAFAADFIKATQGEGALPATLEDAVWVHRIIASAYRASAERREVMVA